MNPKSTLYKNRIQQQKDQMIQSFQLKSKYIKRDP